MKRVAVVILNWNGKALLEQFLPALLANTPADIADVIVADNGSIDNSLAFLNSHYPEIRTIVFEENHGFSEGYNNAFEQINHEYAVLLNSDVEVTPNWLTVAIDYLDKHAEVVALQPKILSYRDKKQFEYAGASGGYMDIYGYPFCRGRILETVEQDNLQYQDVKEVLWASGACLFVRLDEYKKAGGLDANFFAHQEEIDLCWRLVNRGKKIVCLPDSVVYHVGGATLAMEHPRKTFLNFRNNLLMIYKNMPDKYLSRVLFVRFFLDMLAALQFLLKGYPANAKSVLKAHLAYSKLRPTYKEIRKSNLSQTLNTIPKEMYGKSLIFAYYFKRKKKFNELKIRW